jgi:hypothetical protein
MTITYYAIYDRKNKLYKEQNGSYGWSKNPTTYKRESTAKTALANIRLGFGVERTNLVIVPITLTWEVPS